MTTGVNNLIAELQSCTEVLTAQRDAGLDVATLRAAQATSCCAKIKHLRDIGHANAANLTRVLNSMGWSDTEKHALASAVQEQLVRIMSGKKRDVETQKCMIFELYSTAAQIAKIIDPSMPMITKHSTIRDVAKNIGLFHPDEPTKGRMAGVLKYLAFPSEQQPEGEEWYKFN